MIWLINRSAGLAAGFLAASPVTAYTILLCALLFPFGAILALKSAFLTEAFTQSYWNIPLAEFTLVSYMFQHHSFSHLLVNLAIFAGLAPLLEAAIGAWRMLAFTLLTGVGAGLVHYFCNPYLQVPLIGLSGVVIGLLVIVALSAPFTRLVPLPFTQFYLRVWHLALFILGSQVWGYFAGPGMAGGDKTGYFVHFGGAFSGFLLWLAWLRYPLAEFKQSRLAAELFS